MIRKVSIFLLGFILFVNVLSANVFVINAEGTLNATDEVTLKNWLTTTIDNSVVVIDNDISVSSTIVIPQGANVTLDLSGHNITASDSLYVIQNMGTLTIQNSGAEAKIESRGIDNYGKLTLNSGTLSSNGVGGGAAVYNQNEFIMTGGSLITTGYPNSDRSKAPAAYVGYIDKNLSVTPKATITNGNIEVNDLGLFVEGELTIENSTIKSHGPNFNSIKIALGGKAIIKKVNITADNGSGGIYAEGGHADLYETTVNQLGLDTARKYNSTALAVSNNGVLNVYSGTYTSENYGAYVYSSGGTINIASNNYEVISTNKDQNLNDVTSNTNITGPVSINAPTVFKAVIDANKKVESTINVGEFKDGVIVEPVQPQPNSTPQTVSNPQPTVAENKPAVKRTCEDDGKVWDEAKQMCVALNNANDNPKAVNTVSSTVKTDKKQEIKTETKQTETKVTDTINEEKESVQSSAESKMETKKEESKPTVAPSEAPEVKTAKKTNNSNLVIVGGLGLLAVVLAFVAKKLLSK